MYYRKAQFAKPDCSCNIITVSNDAAHNRQGRPTLGESVRLSSRDITQVNCLYNCPGSGRQGFLVLYVRNGVNLQDTDGVGDPDPYVKMVKSTLEKPHSNKALGILPWPLLENPTR